jgi:hypothetical protein
VGAASGVASAADGTYQASMGLAFGDLDLDGRADLLVTNFFHEYTTFYRNFSRGVFVDHTSAVGLAAPSSTRLGFGVALCDLNDDGWPDLATANGHVDDFRPDIPWKMRAQLFAGAAGGRMADVTDQAGPPWQVERLGRGLAAGDLDNDGRVDLLLLGQNEPLAYFHNTTRSGHWLALRLEGAASSSNRDAIGAKVTVTAGGRRWLAVRHGGGSYQSSSDPRLHVGLGDAARVDAIEVSWPSGRVDRIGPLAADAGYHIIEGRPAPAPLAGLGRPRPPANAAAPSP